MISRDLRIGNIVGASVSNGKETISVRGYVTKILFDAVYINGILVDDGIKFCETLLTPILLTGEILLLVGAEKSKYHDYYFCIESGHICFHIFSGKTPVGQANGAKDSEFYIAINGVIIILKHLHQLQNIFHTQTGDELEIQLHELH